MGHTVANGSGRVRQSRGCFVTDGTGPASHSRAVRILIPADAAAAGIGLGFGLGRIGDIINGEHVSNPTTMPWGFVYTHPLSPTNQQLGLTPTHPVQTAGAHHADLLHRRHAGLELTLSARRAEAQVARQRFACGTRLRERIPECLRPALELRGRWDEDVGGDEAVVTVGLVVRRAAAVAVSPRELLIDPYAG